jgi:hypothetical protein
LRVLLTLHKCENIFLNGPSWLSVQAVQSKARTRLDWIVSKFGLDWTNCLDR